MNKSLADLFHKKQKAAAADGIDWDDRKTKYLAAVDALYAQLGAILAEPIAQGAVALYPRAKTLSESYIGTYSVNDVVLVAGNEQVRFSPRGRNIAGAAGRVDVVGERGEAILIYQPDSGWAFVQARSPALRVAPLDEATLTEVLQLVMRD